MPDRLTFRPITDADRDFLYNVYASTRTEELKLTDWEDARKAEFLQMQFSAQHQYYQGYYHDTDFLIIQNGNQPIGRLYVARWDKEIRIVDLSILPEFRNQGFGTAILQDLLAEGENSSRLVSIHVERFNPALNLYARLGFTKKGEHGVYDLMTWATI